MLYSWQRFIQHCQIQLKNRVWSSFCRKVQRKRLWNGRETHSGSQRNLLRLLSLFLTTRSPAHSCILQKGTFWILYIGYHGSNPKKRDAEQLKEKERQEPLDRAHQRDRYVNTFLFCFRSPSQHLSCLLYYNHQMRCSPLMGTGRGWLSLSRERGLWKAGGTLFCDLGCCYCTAPYRTPVDNFRNILLSKVRLQLFTSGQISPAPILQSSIPYRYSEGWSPADSSQAGRPTSKRSR